MLESAKSAISVVRNQLESAVAVAKNTSTSTGATKNAGAEWATRISTSSSFYANLPFVQLFFILFLPEIFKKSSSKTIPNCGQFLHQVSLPVQSKNISVDIIYAKFGIY